MMMGGYGMGLGGGFLGILYMLLPLLILGGIIYYAVQAGTQRNNNVAINNNPRNIAEQRYARGEISFEELEEIRHNLK